MLFEVILFKSQMFVLTFLIRIDLNCFFFYVYEQMFNGKVIVSTSMLLCKTLSTGMMIKNPVVHLLNTTMTLIGHMLTTCMLKSCLAPYQTSMFLKK